MSGSGYVGRTALRDGSIFPSALSVRNRRYVLDMFDARVAGFSGAGTAFAAGATGSTNILKTNAGHYEYFILGAGQTITTPVWDATNGNGLDIALDLTATEGLEICFGAIISTAGFSRGRLNFTIGGEGVVAGGSPTPGSSPSLSFYARLSVRATDASGFNPFQFGFRKVEAFQATGTTAYTDFAAFDATVNGTVADIRQITRLNTGTQVTVDTTLDWADNTNREFFIIVSPSGVVQFFVDGAFAPAVRSGFQFDTGDVVVPFCRLVHGADVAEATFLRQFECGFIKPNAA